MKNKIFVFILKKVDPYLICHNFCYRYNIFSEDKEKYLPFFGCE